MIAEYPLIPISAFLYWPTRQATVEYVDNQKLRVLFGSSIRLDADEKQKVAQFRTLISNDKKQAYLNDYSEDDILKFLQASAFDHLVTIDALHKFHAWQLQNLPLQLTPRTQQLLESGILYVSGRDCYYRPIVIVNIKKILDLKIPYADLIRCLSFFFQFVIDQLMIQGKVEQWIILSDLGNVSMFSLGRSLLDIIAHLSSVFKVRNAHNFVLNCPGGMKFAWGTLKSVLNGDQIRKITMSQKSYLKPEYFQSINPLQIQTKYGGHLPDLVQFWPIQLNPNAVTTANQTKHQHVLLTQQQYNRMFESNELKHAKISRSLLQQFRKHKQQQVQEDRMTQKHQSRQKDNSQVQLHYLVEAPPQPVRNIRPPFSFRKMFANLC